MQSADVGAEAVWDKKDVLDVLFPTHVEVKKAAGKKGNCIVDYAARERGI